MTGKTCGLRAIGHMLGILLAAIVFLAAAQARAQDLNGIWVWSDGTTIAFVQRGGAIEGRVQQPSATASGIYGRRAGDLVLEGRINGARITGTRHYRFPLSSNARCPNVRGGSGAVEMQIVDAGTIKSRRRNGVLLDGCRIGDGGWVDEPYTRQTPIAAKPAPKPAPTPGAPPLDFDRMTTDDLFKICSECLEQGVDYLALKETYPSVKQRWLDLTARRRALGGDAALGRMQAELKQLETALAPPPPADLNLVDAYLDQLSAGWNRHVAGIDAAVGIQARRLAGLMFYLTGVDSYETWTEELRDYYDFGRGKALSPEERRLLDKADDAEFRLRNQQQRRKQYLVQQIALMDESARQIADADAAVNRVEKEILQAIDKLKNCLQQCRR